MLLRYLSRRARPYLRTYGLLQTAKIFNKSAIVWEPGNQRVLVLAPHMDDETIGCGGALAAHASAGSAVTVVFLTDCSRGGQLKGGNGKANGNGGDHASSAEGSLSGQRRAEARRALSILGIERMVFMGARDGELAPTPELVKQLREVLLEVRPSLIYLPCFLEEHPDHRAVSDVLLAASEKLPFEIQCLAYEVWTPLFPNCFVNIDAMMDTKRRAISEYATQLADCDYVHSTLGLNAYRSSALLGRSCSFAEAFLSVALSEYRHLYEDFRHGNSRS
jgi:LmbE family N-acetylglucosaminyl deacetylase